MHLAGIDRPISRLGLGTMMFGAWGNPDRTDCRRIADIALEAGISLFDTADVYDRGIGETIVGDVIAGRRDRVVLATKVGNPMSDDPDDCGLSGRRIIASCDDSLRRLRVDHIDLYQMHHIDRSAPWDEVWQAMETLVAQGKVIYVGSSNFAGWHIAQANEAAKARHFLGLVSEQSLYNLASRTVELEVLPACRSYGLGVIPWSPLAGGMLAGRPDGGGGGRRAQLQPRYAGAAGAVARWEQLCADLGEDPAAVALAWLLHQEGVTAPIIGPRTLGQLEGASLRAIDLTLDAATLTALDEIFPGPGGRAPEAYAW